MKTYTIKYDAYTEHVQGLTTFAAVASPVCTAIERTPSLRTGQSYDKAQDVQAALGRTSRRLCRTCATALEFTVKRELAEERRTAGLPAPEYDRPYKVQFSQTHMKILYTDDEGVTRDQVFQLHRTRPEAVFYLVRSVTDATGRVWEYGMIPDKSAEPEPFVAWPFQA